MSGTGDTNGTDTPGQFAEQAEPARSRTVGRLKVLAVVAAGLGVVVGGSLLAPERAPASPRANWTAVPRSSLQPVYSGPEPTRDTVLEDFYVVTDDAEVGMDVGQGNPLREAWGDCAADYVSFEFVSDQQLVGLVNGLVARGWTVNHRMTEPVLAYTLEKGKWSLSTFAKAPNGALQFSLLALKGTPECEQRFKEQQG
ncbi:hypothetical protein ACFYYB_09290 [Streptomyces sp. NPDC002886]|uniref:hypothetical protein n=1 Tax=Streptomyces sp. NPDC002886 TaxID=3364667 RepID=UPI00368F0EAB